MGIKTLARSRDLSEAAERQMRNWSLGLQSQQRVAEEKAAAVVPRLIKPYVVISREAGVDAGEIAQAVASRCHWKVLDGELLDYMAEHDHLSRIALEFVDEQAVSWFHEMFGKWLDKELVSQAEYVSHLGQLVLLAAQHESTVFVGRGAQFILPRDAGLAVRIIAPRKQRIATIQERRQCSQREAEAFIDAKDDGRAQFVRRYFQKDVADPHMYDLVINLEHVPREEAIELVVGQCRRIEKEGPPTQ